MDAFPVPRLMADSLTDRLRVMPAVVVTGARQTGKSTLTQELAPGARRYFSLDDLDVVDAARRDPEVLREPDLLRAVKRAIGEEVDFVIEADGRLLPIEVKATGRPRLGDTTHLRTFRREYGKRARAGLLLHTGDTLTGLRPMCWQCRGGGYCE